MPVVKVYGLSLALLTGVGTGALLGSGLLSCALGVLLTTGMGALLWRREQHLVGQRHAHEWLVMRVLAERAIRAGEVVSCWGCKRAVRRSQRRCLYCGVQRLEGPLR